MFEYELHQTRTAELQRLAAAERLAAEAVAARRSSKRRTKSAARHQWVKAA